MILIFSLILNDYVLYTNQTNDFFIFCFFFCRYQHHQRNQRQQQADQAHDGDADVIDNAERDNDANVIDQNAPAPEADAQNISNGSANSSSTTRTTSSDSDENRLTTMALLRTFISSFFASLIPETPAV